ncbi:MAG: RNA polymerase sigma factor [Candidatus Wolfebacteria bacterium]|nr:RNA polymerase sigma factor [Candidatus Wolfebacteria bacterium]
MEKFVSDENLVKAHLKGDETAFGILVNRHLGLVYGLARRYTGDQDNASDIAQETFLKIWRNLKKFDTNRNFKAWMLAIAKNSALDWLKAKKAVPFSNFENQTEGFNFIESIIDPLPLPSVVAERNIRADEARALVLRLPQKYSSVVNLHDENGLTFSEISYKTRRPLNTVKSQYHRAIKILRRG